MASIANYFKVKFDSEKKFLNTNTKFATQDIKFRFTGVNALWIYSELYWYIVKCENMAPGL